MFNITIDGLAGCGKSTISKELSKALDYKCLNTGSIYRAITCHFLSKHTESDISESVLREFIAPLDIKVVFNGDKQIVTADAIDYGEHLRDENVSRITPVISSFDFVREKVRDIQRDFAKSNDCIVEGRDIGSVVLPSADCKFFFVASSEVRARRRYEQIKDTEGHPTFDEIKQDIENRDEIDRTREHGAMIPASDAIILDSSLDSVEQTLNRCISLVKSRQK